MLGGEAPRQQLVEHDEQPVHALGETILHGFDVQDAPGGVPAKVLGCAKVAQDAETARVKAAYKKLLTEEKISEKSLDAVLNVTDYSKMKLKEDGTLDGVEDLKKDIDTRWGGFKVQTRQRGERVDTPPAGNNGGGDNSVREMTAKWHAERFGAAPKET